MFAVLKWLARRGIATIPADQLGHTRDVDFQGETAAGLEDAGGAIDPAFAVGTQLATRVRQVFGRSLHVRHLDSGSCNGCEFETMALMNPVYDLQRFGIDFVASPRHADLLLMTGGITRNLYDAVVRTYEATPNPKLVVAVGACTHGDGIIGGTYANVGRVDQLFPVAVYVPGCPPPPKAILEGILAAIDKADAIGL